MEKRELIIEYEEYTSKEELPEDEKVLVEEAWKAREKAHAPYSNFKVGAAVRTEEGEIFKGGNREVANYKGTCAERAAIIGATNAGADKRIAKIAIAGGPESLNPQESPTEEEADFITPCGQCRQDIRGVEDFREVNNSEDSREIIILMTSTYHGKILRVVGIKKLLPFGFGPANLGLGAGKE